MALDTRNKRGSALGIGLAIILPLADGVIDQADRQQTAHAYSGILATEMVLWTVKQDAVTLWDDKIDTTTTWTEQ